MGQSVRLSLFTKGKRKGYPTLAWKLSKEQTKAFSPTSTTRKSSVPDDREFLERNRKPPGFPGEELKDKSDKELSSQFGGDDFEDFDI